MEKEIDIRTRMEPDTFNVEDSTKDCHNAEGLLSENNNPTVEKSPNVYETITKDGRQSGMRKDVMHQLRGMDVNSTIGCPITKISSIRSQASQVGLELNRKYRTRSDREQRVVWVTRIS